MYAKTSTFALGLFVVAFVLRMGLVLALRDIHTGPVGIDSADDVEYNRLALRLARGEGYVGDQGQPTSFRAPGWPLFLAGLYRLAGPWMPLVYSALCLLGAGTCVLTYFLARELVEERTARAAAVLAAIYLPHIYFSTGFNSEILFVTCLTLGVWMFLVARRLDSMPLLFFAGLALSWATLTRPFALLLGPIQFVVLALAPAPRRLLPLLIFAVAFVACIVPWTVRNRGIHGRFVLVATNGGSTFYGGNNERVAHEFRQLGNWISTTELPRREWIDAAPTEVEHDKREWQLGWEWVREHPRTVPLLGVFKLARFVLWLPDFDGGSRLYTVVRALGYIPFFLLIIVGFGVWLGRRDLWRTDWFIVQGVLLATLATALLFWGSPRFRDANMPFLMIFAALGWDKLWRRHNVNETKRCLLTPQTNVNVSFYSDTGIATRSETQKQQLPQSTENN